MACGPSGGCTLGSKRLARPGIGVGHPFRLKDKKPELASVGVMLFDVFLATDGNSRF